jgi:L-serine dehydratase
VDVYGSLALTGMGHGTDKALILGLVGKHPRTVEPGEAETLLAEIRQRGLLPWDEGGGIPFDAGKDLVFNRRSQLPFHTNGMQFHAWDGDGKLLREDIYYSVGGGFVVHESEIDGQQESVPVPETVLPYQFQSAKELLELARKNDQSIADLIRTNEETLRNREEIRAGIDELWRAMQDCIERGCSTDGILPGRLKLQRRAGRLFEQLNDADRHSHNDPMAVMDWVNLWAIAVNEENAAGGRVVTAPTNGAAGIIPAVLRYYQQFCGGASEAGIVTFFLTATAIGGLYKLNASISGAEVGCQGEVGVACSMAAAGLTAALGGSNEQVENAAEIGMEHNLGLTCDPIGGLVQIPCIERNAMGAVKAIDASRMAMLGDGTHRVSLDRVIDTMRRTGADMQVKYKETSRGGLAVNVTEC